MCMYFMPTSLFPEKLLLRQNCQKRCTLIAGCVPYGYMTWYIFSFWARDQDYPLFMCSLKARSVRATVIKYIWHRSVSKKPPPTWGTVTSASFCLLRESISVCVESVCTNSLCIPKHLQLSAIHPPKHCQHGQTLRDMSVSCIYIRLVLVVTPSLQSCLCPFFRDVETWRHDRTSQKGFCVSSCRWNWGLYERQTAQAVVLEGEITFEWDIYNITVHYVSTCVQQTRL